MGVASILQEDISKIVFNATLCLIGVILLLIHVANIALKKERRKDENSLLSFFIFTAIHFLTYFIFVMLKASQQTVSDNFIISFYTVFYIMNNAEALLFYIYVIQYIDFPDKPKRIISIICFALFALFVASDIVNIFARFYFTSVDGVYTRSQLMILSQGYQFIILLTVFILALVNKKLSIHEKIAFMAYCIIPLIAVILQNRFAGYAIAYLALLFAIEILFLFLNVERNIKLREEERKLKDAEIKIMMSQIQPHFIYNTLSSISTLIQINPDEAQKALDDFTDYLRINFSALTEIKLISFEDELRHIQTYVDLEKVRFRERLKVIYDIKVTKFSVPPLSIQPLVENAIKHGILKKSEGGTIVLKTWEDDRAYYVEIDDDGVGFDINDVNFKSNKHIGLNNVRHRISSMSHGELEIESKVNKGTKVVVKFYK